MAMTRSANSHIVPASLFVDATSRSRGTIVWMPSPNHPQGNSDPDVPAKRPREPLYIRMYFQNHLTDLVRLFGYDEIPLERAREELKPLIDKYGQKILEEAVEEIIFIDGTKTPPVARLTDHARTLARQLLGSPVRSRVRHQCHPVCRIVRTSPGRRSLRNAHSARRTGR